MKFVADDGRIFDNLEDCKEYERTHSKITEYANLFDTSVAIYDGEGNRCKPSTDIQHTEEYWKELIEILEDDAWYFNITVNSQKWEEINDFIYDEYGLILPPALGFWRYDSRTDGWKSFDEDIKTMCDRWRKLIPSLIIKC